MNMHEIRAWANCCEEFKAEIKAIAREYRLNFWNVYSLWRLYSKRCDWGDQSPLLSEFREQYRSDLEKAKGASL